MITSKQMLRAEIVKNYTNIDFHKSFFELSSEEFAELEKFKKLFNFDGRNNLGRSELRQFYYHLQRGYLNLPF